MNVSIFPAPVAAVFAAIIASHVQAQAVTPAPTTPTPRLVSPEVNGSQVTFRFRDPNAHEVLLQREGATPVPMHRGEDGVWSITVGPLDPDYYGYVFVADGVALIDPANPLLKPNLLNLSSVVHVPGEGLTWETTDVPHGEVHHDFYHSAIVGDDRDVFVYTPPGYDAGADRRYPVLYLLHGFSDDASAWTAVGRVNFILDNLIAKGQAKPMIVVMPLGYGAPEVLRRGGRGGDSTLNRRNARTFSQTLLEEVIPRVERSYRVLTDRESRAIAGLSMGGAESLETGLNALDRFAWVASFSAGGLPTALPATFPRLNASANRQLRLLWIACGTDDRLIDTNRKFRQWLQARGIEHVDVETPGAHTWMVWRRNLSTLAPLLFRTAP